MKGFHNIATTRQRLRALKWVARMGNLARTMILSEGDKITDMERQYLYHWHSKYQYRRLANLGAPRIVLRNMKELCKSRPAPMFILIL